MCETVICLVGLIWFAVVSPITLLAPSCASAMIPAPNPVLRANISSIAMRS
jgi:hypothetical protein